MASRRIEEEKNVVEQMIRLYCRKSEGHGELCPSCRELLDYAIVVLTDVATVRISQPARNAQPIAIDRR